MLHSLECSGSVQEIAYACGFINSWPIDSIKAIGTISLLRDLGEVTASDAIGAVEAVAKEWGASTYLLFKISYLRTVADHSETEFSVLDEIDVVLGHKEHPSVQIACLEKLHERISLFAVARRHTNTLYSKVIGDFRRSLALHTLVSTPIDEKDCAAYVLRATTCSLIDAVHAIWVVLNLSDRFKKEGAAIARYLDPAIYQRLTESIAQINSLPAPMLLPQSTNGDADEDPSLTFYRRSAAFLEHRAICQFRNDLDRVIGYRLTMPLRSKSPSEKS